MRHVYAYWPLIILDIPALYPLAIDQLNRAKMFAYPSVNQFKVGNPEINRPVTNKYISLDAIGLKITDKDKDIRTYSGIFYSDNITKAIEDEEKSADKRFSKAEDKQLKKNKGKAKKTLDDDKKIEFDDTKYSADIFKTLKSSGYIDTVNKVFLDHSNTLNLEATISKVRVFQIFTPDIYEYFYKSKLYITWYLKNTYGEKIDSISNWQYSSNFTASGNKNDKMYANAIDESFHKLFENKSFTKLLNLDTNFNIADPMLSIPAVTANVAEVSDASVATVTVKRKDGGHGSGFAISNDGYILTNYHVIAGKTVKKQEDITIILPEGEEIPVKIVRFNRMRDIALLKVDKKFEKAFKLESESSYKKLMEVYTIGTPKSIELGQSVSLGLISNERKSNNNHLLQLSISINPGNSGGPLFDKSGKLHGVVTSKLVGFATEGVGFAIPSHKIASYLNIEMK
jgi:S1-C subfamily serine protease